MTHQNGWRWCNKCASLAFSLNGAKPCPAGDTHDFYGSGSYSALNIRQDQAREGTMKGWEYCDKCGVMAFYDPNCNHPNCAGGGGHNFSFSGGYHLPHTVHGSPGQEGWRHCMKCSSFVFAGNGPRPCPAGGQHCGDVPMNAHFERELPEIQARERMLAERRTFQQAPPGQPGYPPRQQGYSPQQQQQPNYRAQQVVSPPPATAPTIWGAPKATSTPQPGPKKATAGGGGAPTHAKPIQ